MQIMTPNHEKWDEFCRLVDVVISKSKGPGGPFFRKEIENTTGVSTSDKIEFFAIIKALTIMGFEPDSIKTTLDYF